MDASRTDSGRLSALNCGRAVLGCLCGLLAAGCGTSYRVEGVFTRPALGTYQRMAMYGLDGNREPILMADLASAFASQQIIFVERERINEIFSEQDRLPDRLDSATRDSLRKVSSVQCIVFGRYEEGTKETKKAALITQSLYVRILDVETGEIVGQAVVHARSKEGALTHDMTKRAVSAIMSSLMAHESMKARTLAPPTSRPPTEPPEEPAENPLLGQP